MKTIVKSVLTLMFMMTMGIVLQSCGGDDDSPISPTDYRQLILGTWKCYEDEGYTVITFKEDGISEWKYLFEDEVSRWTIPYEIDSKYLRFEEDEKKTSYTYTLTEKSLSFDGDEYVKIENYVEEDDRIDPDTNYDNRGAVAKQFRGKGTKTEPYIISDATELRKLADDVDSGKTYRDEYFKMTADVIVNSEVISATGELIANVSRLEQWKPIGKGKTPFCGTFDGNGHTISGIFIQKANRDSLGLFGYFAGTLENLNLKDSYVEGKDYVGGFIGIAQAEKYSKMYKPNVSFCINYATVKGSNEGKYQGGIVGYTKQGTIQRCQNNGRVIGYSSVGGVVGKIGASVIFDCANYGNIKAYSQVGGIMGNIARLKIDETNINTEAYNFYNFGNISADYNTVGGIVGLISHNIHKVQNIVNYGTISVLSDKTGIGALVGGGTYGGVSNGYYLETSYPIGLGGSKLSGSNIQSMTSNQMQSQSFLNELNKNAKALGTKYSQWKFCSDGYPILEWVN